MTDHQHIQILKKLVSFSRSSQFGISPQIGSIASASQYLRLYELIDKCSLQNGARVLDWGAGIGHFSYFLCKSGFRTIGFSMEDFSFRDWIRGCRYRFIRGKESEPTVLPFNASSFDAVLSIGVLEHVYETGGSDLASMREISRILRPNGLFICYHLPNQFSWIEAIGKLLTTKYHHKLRYTKKDIMKLANKAGYQILEVERYGFLPRNSLAKFPENLAYSTNFANIWNTLDKIFSALFSPICQNYYFVAKKKT